MPPLIGPHGIVVHVCCIYPILFAAVVVVFFVVILAADVVVAATAASAAVFPTASAFFVAAVSFIVLSDVESVDTLTEDGDRLQYFYSSYSLVVRISVSARE